MIGGMGREGGGCSWLVGQLSAGLQTTQWQVADIRARFTSFLCVISVRPFVALLKAIYADNVHCFVFSKLKKKR